MLIVVFAEEYCMLLAKLLLSVAGGGQALHPRCSSRAESGGSFRKARLDLALHDP